jgi:hypothetical protein
LKEVQERKKGLLEAVLHCVNNLASSYDNIMQNVSRNQHNEKTNGENIKNTGPFFEGTKGIQARSLRALTTDSLNLIRFHRFRENSEKYLLNQILLLFHKLRKYQEN